LSYEVIARRWRPQDFTGLIGQDHVRTTLINALKNERLHHALLFTGPRGTGKTSTARILAKTLRCPNVKDFVPCNTCSECGEITSGRSVNIVEIDGASNNGVDAIRELRDTVGYLPSSGRFKMYIIDEVHMLSTSAFNALLKTLEEPPPHVYFVMATTEVQKIPATILSRCQRFDFRRVPTRVIAGHLKKICETDKIQFEEDALWTIARQGDGSHRDAQSLLDQVINFTGGNLKRDLVVSTLGLTDRGLLNGILAAIMSADVKAAVEGIKGLHNSGGDAKLLLLDLMEQIRNALLLKAGSDRSLVDLPDSEIDELIKISSPLTQEDLHWLFDMALKGAQDLTKAADQLLVLEMIIMRMTVSPRFGAVVSARPVSAPRPAPQSSAAAGNSVRTESIPQNSAPAATTPMTTSPVDSVAPPPPVLSTPTVPLNQSQQFQQLVLKIKEVNGLVGAQLENCFVSKIQGKDLSLGVAPKHKFLFEKLSQPEFKKKVLNYITSFWGPGYTLNIEIAEPGGAASPEAATPKALAEKSEIEKVLSTRQAVEAHPLVQQAQRVFKAEIKSIQDFKST
jgi:DNA polymerase-3 subunit gamma/tau